MGKITSCKYNNLPQLVILPTGKFTKNACSKMVHDMNDLHPKRSINMAATAWEMRWQPDPFNALLWLTGGVISIFTKLTITKYFQVIGLFFPISLLED